MANFKKDTLKILDYPKTTYYLGGGFDSTGLTVGIKTSKGKIKKLNKSEYTIEAPDYDLLGERTVSITYMDHSIGLPVSVINEPEFEWKTHIFGQSVTPEKNHVNVLENGSIEIVALEGGGKVTEDHDGITFYFTEIDAEEDNFELSAKIDVKKYAKDPYDGQESFGLMVRDIIGEDGDPSLYAANMAAIGGFSRTPSRSNGIQLVTRKGISDPSGEGSQGLTSIMIDKHKPEGSYRLTLKKTNSGFIGQMNNDKEEIIFEPDIMKTTDSKLYIGFFTARLATIEVSDINLSVSKVKTDAPRLYPEKRPVSPDLVIESLERTATEEYVLRIRSNESGELAIDQDKEPLVAAKRVEADALLEIDTHLSSSQTTFILTFLPDKDLSLSDFDMINRIFTVDLRTFNGDIYVSPEGKAEGEGSKEKPVDIDTAIHYIKPGQRIIVLDGRYDRHAAIKIKKYNDGSEAELKTIIADRDAHPVFDFSEETLGCVLSGDYWHIKGIDFTRSKGDTNGFRLGGSHNIIEHCQFYRNGDTGLQISRTDKAVSIDEWPSDNLILNCTSFDNRDPSNNNADGFAAKISCGEGNVFRGCVSYNNIDDGWDLYTKVGIGKIGKVLIENCVTYNNGFVSYNDEWTGDGNGFKMGGEGLRVEHEVRNCVAFNNLTKGFTSNFNPAVKAFNNISLDNQEGNLEFFTFPRNKNEFVLDGFISYQSDNQDKDIYPRELEAENNYLFDGTHSRNSLGVKWTNDNFKNTDFTGIKRDESGNIIWESFISIDSKENN